MAQEFQLAQFANNCDINGQVSITGATTGTLPVSPWWYRQYIARYSRTDPSI